MWPKGSFFSIENVIGPEQQQRSLGPNNPTGRESRDPQQQSSPFAPSPHGNGTSTPLSQHSSHHHHLHSSASAAAAAAAASSNLANMELFNRFLQAAAAAHHQHQHIHPAAAPTGAPNGGHHQAAAGQHNPYALAPYNFAPGKHPLWPHPFPHPPPLPPGMPPTHAHPFGFPPVGFGMASQMGIQGGDNGSNGSTSPTTPRTPPLTRVGGMRPPTPLQPSQTGNYQLPAPPSSRGAIDKCDRKRSPNTSSTSMSERTFACPLCGIPLDEVDVKQHFFEEVHKVETLRKINSWSNSSQNKEANMAANREGTFSPGHGGGHPFLHLSGHPGPHPHHHPHAHHPHHHLSPSKKICSSRWETYQRVKQNRHARLTALVRSTRRRFDVEMTPEEHHQMNHAAAAAAAAAGMQPPGIPAGGLPPPTSSSSSSANPPHPSMLGHSGRHGNVFFPRPTHPLAGGPPPPPSSGPSQPPISSSGSNLAQPIPQRAASNNSPLNIQPPKPSVLNGGSNASSSMADKVWNFNAEFAKFGGPIESMRLNGKGLNDLTSSSNHMNMTSSAHHHHHQAHPHHHYNVLPLPNGSASASSASSSSSGGGGGGGPESVASSHRTSSSLDLQHSPTNNNTHHQHENQHQTSLSSPIGNNNMMSGGHNSSGMLLGVASASMTSEGISNITPPTSPQHQRTHSDGGDEDEDEDIDVDGDDDDDEAEEGVQRMDEEEAEHRSSPIASNATPSSSMATKMVPRCGSSRMSDTEIRSSVSNGSSPQSSPPTSNAATQHPLKFRIIKEGAGSAHMTSTPTSSTASISVTSSST